MIFKIVKIQFGLIVVLNVNRTMFGNINLEKLIINNVLHMKVRVAWLQSQNFQLKINVQFVKKIIF